MASSHELLIVSGPNGSGKTTLAEFYSADFDYPYLGADKIAAELSSTDPASQSVSASREFSRRLKSAVLNQQSTVVESTLSGRTFVRAIRSARAAGFRVSIVHLFLSSADMCVARVAERVQKGGHHVPEVDVRRRFDRCARNFWHLYRPLCDRWALMYNATTAADLVATGSNSTHSVLDPQLFGLFTQVANS